MARRPCNATGPAKPGDPYHCVTHRGDWWLQSSQCDNSHIEDGDEVSFLLASIRKLRDERKTLHSMLSEAGISEDVLHDGVRTCLIGRVGVALGRLNA